MLISLCSLVQKGKHKAATSHNARLASPFLAEGTGSRSSLSWDTTHTVGSGARRTGAQATAARCLPCPPEPLIVPAVLLPPRFRILPRNLAAARSVSTPPRRKPTAAGTSRGLAICLIAKLSEGMFRLHSSRQLECLGDATARRSRWTRRVGFATAWPSLRF